MGKNEWAWCEPGAPVPVSQKLPASWACHAQQCLGFTENGVMNKKRPVSGSPVGKNSSLMRGRRRMARIMQANRWATNRRIMAQYNSGVQNGISERTTRRSLSRMGYCSKRPHQVPLQSAKNRKKSLQWSRHHQHWTIEEWKNFAWSDESQFLLRHADGRVRIWCKQHESMAHPTWCPPGTGWWGIGVGNVFLAHIRYLDTK
jgi:hypothetical protein